MDFLLKYFQEEFAKKRIFGLDILRALAIVLVVGSHAFHILEKTSLLFLHNIFLPDGVEIFFVLSGFLVGGNLIKQLRETNPSQDILFQFWKRRWFRTLPAYYVVIILLCLIYHVFPIRYFLFLQNFWVTEWDPNWFYSEGWSLSIEEWFYLLMPLLLFILPWKKNPIVLLLSLFSAVTLTLIVKWVVAENTVITDYQSWSNHFRKIVLLRMDGLFMGVILAAGKEYFNAAYKKLTQRSIVFLGLAIVFANPFLFQQLELNSIYNKVFFTSVTGLGVALCLPYFAEWTSSAGKLAKGISLLSIISYSMYLLNRTIILHKLFGMPQPTNLSKALLIYAFYWIVVIVFSLFFYLFIERPLMNLRDKI